MRREAKFMRILHALRERHYRGTSRKKGVEAMWEIEKRGHKVLQRYKIELPSYQQKQAA